MPGAIPDTNTYPEPRAAAEVEAGVPRAVAVIRDDATTLRHRGYGFLPFMQDAQKAAERVEFATDAEVKRDVTARAREYTAQARDETRRALARARALHERSADLIPKAAVKARKRQDAILSTARAQALHADLASRFAVADTAGYAGHAQLELARQLHDQFTREGDAAGLYALRVVARPYLNLGSEHGDAAFRARDLLRTFRAEDEAARGDVPALEREHEAVTRALADLEGEVGLLIDRLGDVFPEPPDVWRHALTPEPDPRAAWDAVPGLWKDTDA